MRAGVRPEVFSSADAMIAAAAAFVRTRIDEALAARGSALLLLSGGSTPLPLYRRLAATSAPWARVCAVLVDERWVGADHPASNERAIRAALAGAEGISIVGLKTAAATAAEAASAVEERLARLAWPADVAVLGMGPDGHTASWFPNAAGLAEALDEASGRRVAAVRARPSVVTGAETERLTLTVGPVLEARARLLLMTGEEKRRVFAEAHGSGPVDDKPVRALFAADPEATFVAWAPS